MARCRCAEGACGCTIVAGSNTTVDGTGTSKDPYVISSADFGHLAIADTATLDLHLSGDGSSANPHLLTGNVITTGAGVNEVWIGTTDPILTNPTIELWFDPDAVSGLPRDELLDRISALEAQLATKKKGKS